MMLSDLASGESRARRNPEALTVTALSDADVDFRRPRVDRFLVKLSSVHGPTPTPTLPLSGGGQGGGGRAHGRHPARHLFPRVADPQATDHRVADH